MDCHLLRKKANSAGCNQPNLTIKKHRGALPSDATRLRLRFAGRSRWASG